MPNLKLYHCVNSRSVRPLWMLEELNAHYDLRTLAFPPRIHDKKFKTINALGTVPCLTYGSTWMSESAAMCQYIPSVFDPINKHGLVVKPTEKDYGFFLNWLHHGEATLTFPQTLMLRYDFFATEPKQYQQVAKDYEEWFLSRLNKGIALHLNDREFLCADRFTAADVSVGYSLHLAEIIGLRPKFAPSVDRYWGKLKERDGYQRMIQKQLASAKEEKIDITKEVGGSMYLPGSMYQ